MSPTLRPSRVLAKLRAGKVASCVKLNFGDARVAELAAGAGFDAVWIDMEHVPNGTATIENQIRAIKLHGADALVRVKRGSYSDLIHPLEADAAGIMVPHVMSADDARSVVRQTRFYPIGRRPLDGGNVDGGFCAVPMDVYLKQANEQRFVIVQIEDPEPLEELDAIAATPGIDMLFFGPGDFSHAIGAPGQWDDPRIAAARKAVAEAALKHNKFAGTVGSVATLSGFIDEGYRFINIGADVIGLSTYFDSIVKAFGGAGDAPASKSVYGDK